MCAQRPSSHQNRYLSPRQLCADDRQDPTENRAVIMPSPTRPRLLRWQQPTNACPLGIGQRTPCQCGGEDRAFMGRLATSNELTL
jgi:hypothetical protein